MVTHTHVALGTAAGLKEPLFKLLELKPTAQHLHRHMTMKYMITGRLEDVYTETGVKGHTSQTIQNNFDLSNLVGVKNKSSLL